jgi:hypothetical protein
VTTAAAPVSYGSYAAPMSYAAPRPVSYAAPMTTMAAPVSYGAPAYGGFGGLSYGATPVAAANIGGATVIGADRNFDGIPDVLEGLPA